MVKVLVNNKWYKVEVNYTGESSIYDGMGKRVNEEINGDTYYTILCKAKGDVKKW